MEHCRGSLVREGGSLESYWCPAPQEFKSLPRRKKSPPQFSVKEPDEEIRVDVVKSIALFQPPIFFRINKTNCQRRSLEAALSN